MTDDKSIEREVEQTLAALDVSIPAESQAAVAAHVRILRQHAAAVMAFPLDDDTEPAPVFRP
jgi:hypothetical protein